MQSSNTLPAFDDPSWLSLTQDMSWLPSSSTADFDFNQFMDFDLALAGPSTTTGTAYDDRDEWIAQPAEPEKISTVFNHNMLDADGNVPDFDLLASDGVRFAVNAAKLHMCSFNAFGGLLLRPSSIVAVPLSSTVLSLLLHILYALSITKYAPTFDELEATIDAFERYGLSKAALLSRIESPLCEAILLRAPSEPFECYSLAAHAGLETLARAISPYTTSLHLSDLTEADTERMGPSYLRRLFFLHLGRLDALKRILRPPPMTHPPTEDCDGYKAGEAWAKRAAEIAWNACPNISTISLDSRLAAVAKETDCPECLLHLDHRIKKLLAEWMLVKNTI